MAINILTKKSRGFTLVELLVVIAIIALLTTLAAVAVRYARAQAKISKAEQAINQIYTAMSMLANDSNLWPGQQTVGAVAGGGAGNEICGDGCAYGLGESEAGIIDTDGNYPGWQGPYMINMPLDPWDNEYFFDTDYSVDADNNPCGCGGGGCVDAAVVGSYGPDGTGNNSYNCDDIIKIIAK